VHGDNQGVIVLEEDGVGIYIGEGEWPTRDRRWANQAHSTGHVDIDGLLLRSGALYQGGTKDGVYLLIVDEDLCCLTPIMKSREHLFAR